MLRQQAAKPPKDTVMGGNHLTAAQPHPGFTSVPLLSVLSAAKTGSQRGGGLLFTCVSVYKFTIESDMKDEV